MLLYVRPVCTVGQQQHWTKTGTKAGGGQRAETYSSTRIIPVPVLLVQWNAGRESRGEKTDQEGREEWENTGQSDELGLA